MGSKYEVKAWEKLGDDYNYNTKYYGNSLTAAIWTIFRIKKSGCKCIQFTIRW